MRVYRQLRNRQRNRLRAALLAQNMATADMNRRLPAQIRQREVGLPVAAEGGAEQREQRLILVDRKKLAVAHRPTPGRVAK